MKSPTDLPSHNLAILLIGPPKSRKTSLAMQFPSPYFLDADGNLAAVSHYYPNKEFWWDRADIDTDGSEIDVTRRWNRAQQLLATAARDPRPKTIVVDTLNRLCDWLAMQIVATPITGAPKATNVSGIPTFSQWHWFPFGNVLRALCGDLRTLSATGKIIVCICHEKDVNDDNGNRVGIVPAIGGQSAKLIGGLFTDVWHCEAVTQPDGTISYRVRTQPNGLMALGNSLGLPPLFDFSWKEVEARLNDMQKEKGKTK
jgi:hypothetical protein